MGESFTAIEAAERLLDTLQRRSGSEQALMKVPGLMALIREQLPEMVRQAHDSPQAVDGITDVEALAHELNDGLSLDYQLELARWFSDRGGLPLVVANALVEYALALEAAADAHLALQSAIGAADLQQTVA